MNLKNMTSYQSVLELYVKKRKEIKISDVFACNTKDRITTYHAKIVYDDQIVIKDLDTIYSVIKETLSQESTIYDLSFQKKKHEKCADITWSTRNGSYTIIDEKIILYGIQDHITYQYSNDGEIRCYDTFTLNFDDLIDIDGAINLARNVILQTTSELIYGFRWLLKIKKSSLIYAMTWMVVPLQFPDFLTVPNNEKIRNIFTEEQLKQMIRDHTVTKHIKDDIPSKDDNHLIYRIKDSLFFEEMTCIDYMIYVFNTYAMYSEYIIYNFRLRKTYYNVKNGRIYHRIVWYIKSSTAPSAVVQKSIFLKTYDRKRKRE
jgi:hypothetical protein